MSRRSISQRNTIYRQKITTIDRYIERQQSQKDGNLLMGRVLQLLATKLVNDPPLELAPFVQRNIIFDASKLKSVIIRQQTAPLGKKFVINFNCNVQVIVLMKTNQHNPRVYKFSGTKAIMIDDSSWESISLDITVDRVGIFSIVKVCLNLIQMEFKGKKNSIVTKPNIDQELNDYLQKNRGKSKEILKSRSMSRYRKQQTTTARTEIGTSQSARTLFSAGEKKQLIHFEKEKKIYIQNLRKMSPSRSEIVKSGQQRYQIRKNQTFRNMAKLVFLCKLGSFIREQRIKYHKLIAKKMKITFLCQDFITILKNKYKLKITQQARMRMTALRSIKFLPEVFHPSAVTRARETIRQAFVPYMDYQMVKEVGQNSQLYLEKIILLQRYVRRKKNKPQLIKLIQSI